MGGAVVGGELCEPDRQRPREGVDWDRYAEALLIAPLPPNEEEARPIRRQPGPYRTDHPRSRKSTKEAETFRSFELRFLQKPITTKAAEEGPGSTRIAVGRRKVSC